MSGGTSHRRIVRGFFFLLVVLLAFAFPVEPVGAYRTSGSLRILLIGNSMLHGLRRPLQAMLVARGFDAHVSLAAPGVWDLAHHVQSRRTQDRIASKPWDYVFLQEQSSGIYEGSGYSAARVLDATIVAAGAETAFIMTWRERGALPSAYDGLLGVPGGTFGYLPIALELGAPIAPVGWGVRNAILNGDIGVDLWKSSLGRHLSGAGQYLAACIVYAMLTGESASGLVETRYVDSAVAAKLEAVAEYTVLGDPAAWNISDP